MAEPLVDMTTPAAFGLAVPASAHTPAEQPSRRRKVFIGLVSAATIAWLLAQLWASWTVKDSTWPVAGFGMFSNELDDFVKPRLDVTTAGGTVVRMAPADFGLKEDQFGRYLLRYVTVRGTESPNAGERLAQLVELWNRRHPGERARSVNAYLEVFPLPGGAPSRRLEALTWPR